MSEEAKPAITIEYCVPCGYAPRATWLALELLTPFSETISGLTLVPGGHGIFDVRVDNETVFSNKGAGRFPEVAELVDSISKYTGPVEYRS